LVALVPWSVLASFSEETERPVEKTESYFLTPRENASKGDDVTVWKASEFEVLNLESYEGLYLHVVYFHGKISMVNPGGRTLPTIYRIFQEESYQIPKSGKISLPAVQFEIFKGGARPNFVLLVVSEQKSIELPLVQETPLVEEAPSEVKFLNAHTVRASALRLSEVPPGSNRKPLQILYPSTGSRP
jgi:hypothetical protein